MPVRQNDEVDRGQVYVLDLDVVFKNCRVVASVEEDTFACDFDERRITPVFLKISVLAERIKQNREVWLLQRSRNLRHAFRRSVHLNGNKA